MQSKLSEKRGKPEGHAPISGGDFVKPERGRESVGRLRQHVRAQQFQARKEGQETRSHRR